MKDGAALLVFLLLLGGSRTSSRPPRLTRPKPEEWPPGDPNDNLGTYPLPPNPLEK